MATPTGETAPKILEGHWDDNVSWEFYLTDQLPDPSLCTAVFCLAIVEDTGEIVLARGKRGWEMLGGHLEPGETIEQALVREAIEEGGFLPDHYAPFGYRKILAKEPVINDHGGGTYPTTAYIPHFIATTNKPLTQPTMLGSEILESRTFGETEIPELQPNLESIILLGLEQYHRLKERTA